MPTNITIQELIKDISLDKIAIKVLLCHVLKLTRSQLISNNDYVLTPDELQQYYTLAQQCKNGIPIAYLIGYKEFYSRQFKVTPDTLIPRPETELLVDEVIKLAPHNGRILDLGTGSGCIAITCKLERPDLTVVAVDKFLVTLKIAMENAYNLGAAVKFLVSDWFSNVEGKFDIIVSNPPYIEKNDPHLIDLSFEPQHALTDFADGLSCYRDISANARAHLTSGGYLIFEHGFNQKDNIGAILQSYGYNGITTQQDYASCDRITRAQH